MIDTPHEHDEEGNCIPPEGGFPAWQPPAWRFSPWDIVGISFHTVSGVLGALSNGTGLLAQEFSAAANYSRNEYALREAQKQHAEAQKAMGADLLRMIEGGDGP